MKRTTDLILSLLAIVPALLVCLFCMVLIRIESRGPSIFRQIRIGRHRKPFTLYKLRTMAVNTGDRASHEVSASQITKTGQFLRRTKLDELPQILNVLLGDMSFVGPRPCLPNQTQLIEARTELDVFDIRPGITGPAQLAGIDMSTPVELAKADAAYRSSQSFRSDFYLLLATASGSGSGDAVMSRSEGKLSDIGKS